MTNEIYSLSEAGIQAWDVFTSKGRFAGLIVTKKDGTLRHYYNMDGTKGSARKFKSINEALDNVRRRRAFIATKRAAA